MVTCGVDGCRSGWVVARRENGLIGFSVVSGFSDILQLPVDVIAIDIPIGLPESGPRHADRLARQHLGWPRCCSVFSAPIRPLLTATTWREANTRRQQIENKGFSQQSWGIVDKIREVDAALQKTPEHQHRVFEVHPELSFWQMAGKPMQHPKKKPAGRLERLKQLTSFGVSESDIHAHARRLGCNRDDVIDALAALWTAERIARREVRRFPEADHRDAVGILMRIWA